MNQKHKELISVIIPVYGCRDSLKELYQRLIDSVSKIGVNLEIIMIDDNSPDFAWNEIKSLSEKDDRVKGIKLSRNFGQHRAITAGLDFSKGDWIVVMDCDLQDQPEEIVKLYKKAKEGYDVVVGKRVKRKDKPLKIFGSKIFYKIYNYFTETNVDSSIGNFGIYSRKVINSINRLREQSRSFGLFVLWSGFKRIEIEIKHSQRKKGESSYSFSKLLNLAVDSIVAHSNKPLKLSVKLGFALSFISLIYAIWLIVKYFVWSIPVLGWTSIIVSIYFIAGLIIGNIGMLGIYIGKIFDEVKGRPLYLIDEVTFLEEENGK